MKNTKNILLICLMLCMSITALSGCFGESDSVQGLLVSEQEYSNESDMKNAEIKTEFPVGTQLFANVYFIESPKGMKYTAKWLLDGSEIKSEEKEMSTDKTGMISYVLEGEKIKAGKLKLQIIYKAEVLREKEFTVK